MGKGIYKHMWLFKGEASEEDIEVGIGQTSHDDFPNQSHFGGGTSVHFSLAVLHGYQLPPALLHVAEALRYEHVTSLKITLLQNFIPGMRLREQCLKRGLVLENGRREGLVGLMQRIALSGEENIPTFTFWKIKYYHFYFLVKQLKIFRLGNGGYFSPAFPRCIFIVGDEYNLWNRWAGFQLASML